MKCIESQHVCDEFVFLLTAALASANCIFNPLIALLAAAVSCAAMSASSSASAISSCNLLVVASAVFLLARSLDSSDFREAVWDSSAFFADINSRSRSCARIKLTSLVQFHLKKTIKSLFFFCEPSWIPSPEPEREHCFYF